MINISGTQSTEEMTAALAAHGLEVSAPNPDATEKTPVVAGKKSESKPTSPEAQPGGSDDTTAPVTTETGEKKPQEVQAAPPVEATPPAEPKPGEPGKKFEPQLERRKDLERKVARLHEDLDLERGSKAALQAKLEAAQTELAALKPSAPAKKPDEPVEPKWPTKAEFDFDDEKHEAAVAEYHKSLKVYTQQMTAKAVADALAAKDADDKRKADEAEVGKFFEAYNVKLAGGVKDLSDYQELLEDPNAEFNIETPEMFQVKLAIMESDHPALLLRHFMLDARDNDAKELTRLAGMSDASKVKALTRLEDKLVAEREKKPDVPVVEEKPAVTTPVAAAPPEPPAKPKLPIKPVVDEPLDTVGARTGARKATLADADGKGLRAYVALRQAGVNTA